MFGFQRNSFSYHHLVQLLPRIHSWVRNKKKWLKQLVWLPVKFFNIKSLHLFPRLCIKNRLRSLPGDLFEDCSVKFTLKVPVNKTTDLWELQNHLHSRFSFTANSRVPCSVVIQSRTQWHTCISSCPPTPPHSRPPLRPRRLAPAAGWSWAWRGRATQMSSLSRSSSVSGSKARVEWWIM